MPVDYANIAGMLRGALIYIRDVSNEPRIIEITERYLMEAEEMLRLPGPEPNKAD